MQENKRSNFWLGFFIGLATVSVVCFIGLLIFVLVQGESVDLTQQAKAEQENEQATADTQEAAPAPVPPVSEDDHIKGNKNAKLILIEYSDFECPYCAKHFETMKQIEKSYGDEVAIVFRHFPLSFHSNAQKAAEASECAAEQGEFWQMHEALFTMNVNGNMSLAQIKSAAEQIGLDTEQFNDCLDSGKMEQKVAEDIAGAQQAGVSGTPGTFINGQLVSGALPFDQIKQMIDQILAQ